MSRRVAPAVVVRGGGLAGLAPRLGSKLRLLVVVFGVGVLLPSVTAAQRAPVVVMAPFTGPRASAIRATFIRKLRRRRYRLVSWHRVRGRDYRKRARRIGAQAVLFGAVRRRRGRWHLRVRLIDLTGGGSGLLANHRGRSQRSILRVAAVVARRAAARISRISRDPGLAGDSAFPRRSPTPRTTATETGPQQGGLRQLRTPTWVAQSRERDFTGPPAHQTKRTDASLVKSRSGRELGPPLAISLRADLFSRSLRFNDHLFGGTRSFDLTLAPAAGGQLVWYPTAHFGDGLLAHLGLVVDASYTIPSDSKDSTGQAYPTRAFAAWTGLRGRLAWGKHQLYSTLGVGLQSFQIRDAPAAAKPEVPSVAYRHLRWALGSKIALWRGLALELNLAYLPVLNAGEITSADYFPRASVSGIDVAAQLRLPIAYGLQVDVGTRLRRFFYDLNPQPGDRNVAGGAVDQYLNFTIGLAYAMQ